MKACVMFAMCMLAVIPAAVFGTAADDTYYSALDTFLDPLVLSTNFIQSSVDPKLVYNTYGSDGFVSLMQALFSNGTIHQVFRGGDCSPVKTFAQNGDFECKVIPGDRPTKITWETTKDPTFIPAAARLAMVIAT